MKQTKKLYNTLISEYKKRIDEMKVKLAFKDISKEDRVEIEIQLAETTEKLNSYKDFWKDKEED
jgi:hypothetical protein